MGLMLSWKVSKGWLFDTVGKWNISHHVTDFSLWVLLIFKYLVNLMDHPSTVDEHFIQLLTMLAMVENISVNGERKR